MCLDDGLAPLIIRYAGGARFLASVLRAPCNTPDEWQRREVVIYWGDAGLGKSRAVREWCYANQLTLWVAPIGARGTPAALLSCGVVSGTSLLRLHLVRLDLSTVLGRLLGLSVLR